MVSYMDADLNFQFSSNASSSIQTITPSNVSSNSFSSSLFKNLLKKSTENNKLRAQIVTWLKTMSLQERFKVFMIDNVKIAQIILRMFWKQNETGQKGFAKYQNATSKTHQQEVSLFMYEEFEKQFYCRIQHENDFFKSKNKKMLEAEKELIENLKILDINGIYDTLCFDERYLENIDEIIKVFTVISEQNLFLFEASFKFCLDDTTIYFPEWFNPHSIQSLSNWVVSYLEESIKKKYLSIKGNNDPKANVRDNAEDFLQRFKDISSYWRKINKVQQEKIIENSINSFFSLKEDSQDSILNPEIKKFYLKYKEKISLASFSQTEIFSHYKELLSDDKFLIKIHFESLHNTTSLFSLCNKIIQHKILLLFSSKLQDNTDSTKKKKKKKSKKKNKTPENFTLFDKKKCIFSESPDKDKTNFCDIWTFSQNIAKDMIDYSIKSVLKPEEGFKIEKFELVIDNSVIKSRDPTPRKSLNSIEIKLKETIDLIPLKEKEHRAVEHVEHNSETTCTKDTKSVTESDFPNIFDDLAIFDEMDKQKLSKKQKKKLKKKKKTNKTSETAEKTSEPEIILLTKEKSSDKYEQFSEISKEIIEPALENNNEKSQEIIAIIVDKTNIINENIKIEEKIEKILEPLAVVEKEFEIEKPIEIFKKPLEVVEKFIEEKGEFIEVTKKIPKNVNINNKRFATFCTKPEPTSYRSTMKNTYLEKKEINEDRFKIEKDSRKKPLETKTFQKSVPIYLKSKAVNLINTTEIELASDKNKTNYKESEEKDFQIKTEHGVTLCKKKHAKEVLMAKIKRKEVERYKITPKSSENNFNSNSSEKIDVIVNDKIIFEKKEIFITKEIQDFSFKKDCKSLSQKIFWKKMENDLNKFTDNIANECQRMKVYRVCVFDRIEFIVSNLFATFNAHIKMYGSCVTGLELPYSDLDIGVSGFEKISKFETENILSLLLENLSYMKWVKLCKPIFTANVPLLKLELDPTMCFNEFTYPNPPINYINSKEKYDYLNVKTKIYKPIIIKVDISLENVSNEFPSFILGENVGTLSTNLINHYLHIYPNLHKLIITFKHFLYQKEYNKSYQGGISSYCVSLMIIAYLMENSHKFNHDSPEILTDIFYFYGKKFNPKETGISIKMKPSPFFKILPNTEYGKLIIFEPITNSKNLAINTYLIDKILFEFGSVFDRIEKFKQEFEDKIKQFNYNKIKFYEKSNYAEIAASRDFSDLMKTDIVDQIICEEY